MNTMQSNSSCGAKDWDSRDSVGGFYPWNKVMRFEGRVNATHSKAKRWHLHYWTDARKAEDHVVASAHPWMGKAETR